MVEHINHGSLSAAARELTSLIDRQWKVPENTYLLGILLLLRGQVPAGRRAIDTALSIKPWLTELPLHTSGLRTATAIASEREPDWLWPSYRRELDRFVTFGLTLGSALSARFEHHDVQLVQIGANDGVATDPMRGWISKFGWRALLVEPMPEPFGALEQLYRDADNVTTVNVAIAASAGRRDMWTDAGSRHGVSTFLPDRNILRRAGGTRRVSVTCMTLDQLLHEHGVETIDVLQVDTEGYDFEVLKLVDFDRVRPSVIHLEFYLLPLHERLEIFSLFAGRGYAWRQLGADLLAVDHDLFAEQFGLVAIDALTG